MRNRETVKACPPPLHIRNHSHSQPGRRLGAHETSCLLGFVSLADGVPSELHRGYWRVPMGYETGASKCTTSRNMDDRPSDGCCMLCLGLQRASWRCAGSQGCP